MARRQAAWWNGAGLPCPCTSAHMAGPAAPTHLPDHDSWSLSPCIWTDGTQCHVASAIPCEKEIRLLRDRPRQGDKEGSLHEAQWKNLSFGIRPTCIWILALSLFTTRLGTSYLTSLSLFFPWKMELIMPVIWFLWWLNNIMYIQYAELLIYSVLKALKK